MPQPDFAIHGTAVKDMTDADLAKHLAAATADQGAAGNNLNAAIQAVQVTAAVANVLRYEQNRRANTIQLATSLKGLAA